MEMVHYLCISYNISKSDATLLLENLMLDDRGFIQDVFQKKISIKNKFYNYYNNQSKNVVKSSKTF